MPVNISQKIRLIDLANGEKKVIDGFERDIEFNEVTVECDRCGKKVFWSEEGLIDRTATSLPDDSYRILTLIDAVGKKVFCVKHCLTEYLKDYKPCKPPLKSDFAESDNGSVFKVK
jgi:hypothetical protein